MTHFIGEVAIARNNVDIWRMPFRDGQRKHNEYKNVSGASINRLLKAIIKSHLEIKTVELNEGILTLEAVY